MLRAVAIMVATAAIVATAMPAVAQSSLDVVDVDGADYPTVSLTIDVGPSVMPVTQFTVFEDGIEVASAAHRLTSGHEVVLLVDASGSMRGTRLAGLQEAAEAFVAELHPDVAVALTTFASEVEPVVAMTRDRNVLATGIAAIDADGQTALFDALLTAAQQFSSDADQRTLVVFADGEDNHSAATLAHASAVLTDAAIRVITVELLTEVSDGNALRSLAAATSGDALEAAAIEELTDRYVRAAQLIGSRYRLSYVAEATTAASVIVAASTAGAVTYASPVEILYPPDGATSNHTEDSVAPVVLPDRRGDVEAAESPPAGMLAAGAAAVAVALVLLAVALAPEPARLDADRRGAIGANPGGRLTTRSQHSFPAGVSSDRLRGALERAGVAQTPTQFVVRVAGAAMAATTFVLVLVSPITAVFVAVMSVWSAKLFLDVAAGRRRKAFADQLDDTLQLLAASLRAGHSLLQAVDTVSREAVEPTATEFRRIINATRVGQDLSHAMDASVQRTGSEDFSWVAQAIAIHREVGGNLAEVLDTVGDTIRERNQIRRQVQALSAEGKLSAIVLMGLPVGILFFLGVVNPTYLARFTGEPIGWVMLAAVVVLMTCGGLWLRKLIKIEF